MEKTYQYLVQSVQDKTIDRQVAIDLIKLLESEAKTDAGEIAIIGMAAKLPSADTIREFWSNVENGVNCIADFPETRSRDISRYLAFKGIPEEEIRYSKSAYLPEIDKFDYQFFKLSPREASLMDPCQRLFLETSWQAIEDAGYGGSRLEGSKTGVFVGYASNFRDMYAKIIEDIDPSALSIGLVGNLTAVISGRLSYLLDLKGTSMVIDTACSSSLVAIDAACQALRSGSCEVAVAGGINVNTVPVNKDYMQTGIESTDGVSRAFDNYADGSGVGEGIGAIILKPLKDALRDKDHVYAVIKGSATNQDGRSAGLTAPNPQAQTDVILQAWENAGIDPESIRYIETHGTGTNLGDPIEIQGIHGAFRKHSVNKGFCAVSSVKTNIGHLSEAAGIVSVIKAVMALQTKQLPPTIHFNEPNRSIPFEDSPVYVNTRLRPWESGAEPRRCGVSAFGISGTNCHIVLEEAPQRAASAKQYPGLFTLSAKSKPALLELIGLYEQFLADNSKLQLEEVCHSANAGRGHYAHRLALLPATMEDLHSKLASARRDLSETAGYQVHRVIDSAKQAQAAHEVTAKEQERLSAKAAEAAAAYWEAPEASGGWIEELAQLYLAGADVNWDQLAGENAPHKVPLPAYPFERSRCWIDAPLAQPEAAQQKREADFLYGFKWVAEPLPESAAPAPLGEVLMVKDGSGSPFVQAMIGMLQERGVTVIVAELGGGFICHERDRYTIGVGEDDYDQLMAELNGRKISHILHMCGLSDRLGSRSLEELENSQQFGVYSLVRLTRAVMRHDSKTKLHMVLFTKGLHAATGVETQLRPEWATLTGLGKVIPQEFDGIACKAIDVDESTPAAAVAPELERYTKQFQACYRDGIRYTEEYGPVNPEEQQPAEVEIRTSGVYLITGGTGGIGLETAKYLASKAAVNVALISRSPLPPKEEWADLIASGNGELPDKLRKLQELEAMGAAVTVHAADVADFAVMTSVIAKLRNQYGRINGIAHGAGVAGAGYLFKKDMDMFDRVLRPKLAGTWILDTLTREDQLDFFIMQSSGVSMVGEAGQGDYVAANAYLDAFSAYRRKQGRHALTVNWVSWKEAGMSVRFGINIDSIYKALPTAKAIEGLNSALGRNLTRVLVGEMNESPAYLSLHLAFPFHLAARLNERIHRILNGSTGLEGGSVVSNGDYDAAMLDNGRLIILPKGSAPARRSGEPVIAALRGKGGADYNAVEQEVANIFSTILGYPEIDIHDTLFELGGDSLLLMRIHKLIDAKYPGKVTITDMFEFPSVQRLAQHINKEEQESAVEEMDVRLEARNIFGKLADGTMSLEDAIHVLEDL
ncbi:SDR family NAD(P)-dependent oxidoreductase [Paenibacillus pasadenensis]|uniref:SDR family NAD(P)-dependent oxidoreductase n=1 Tax=Paenibacillus pasadenensis TaxID=217090 RepID=UPI00203E617A|nr:SDR family NAD(P)-dependent oxidoreductase [Paenibacillus pasadenensis]MCM3746402.1 SDR family NAD(P)-dependent oxidoreductase [Paenibacillus pasadenensis]